MNGYVVRQWKEGNPEKGRVGLAIKKQVGSTGVALLPAEGVGTRHEQLPPSQ